jgi:hypothetical protein
MYTATLKPLAYQSAPLLSLPKPDEHLSPTTATGGMFSGRTTNADLAPAAMGCACIRSAFYSRVLCSGSSRQP